MDITKRNCMFMELKIIKFGRAQQKWFFHSERKNEVALKEVHLNVLN